MKVTQYNEQEDLLIDKKGVSSLISGLLSFLQVKTDEVVVHFLPLHAICQIHEHFFDDASPTDCMTFPIDPPETAANGGHHLLGEMVISPKTALEYSPEAPYEELSLYICHCLLHLIGYKDGTTEEQLIMREKEQELLSYARTHELLLKAKQTKSLKKNLALNSLSSS